MRIAAAVALNPEQRQALERMARSRSMPARLVERARIVLLAADGMENKQIARRMNLTEKKTARWRSRFLAGGIAALQKDARRPGKPRTIAEQQVKRVVEMTLHQKPVNATHWSTRTMAAAAGISEASVRRIWHAHGLKPHLVRTFKLSRDPQFTEKLEDIVGLYLNPPEHAIAGGPFKPSVGLSGVQVPRLGTFSLLLARAFWKPTPIQSPRVLRGPWRNGENCSTPSLPDVRTVRASPDCDECSEAFPRTAEDSGR